MKNNLRNYEINWIVLIIGTILIGSSMGYLAFLFTAPITLSSPIFVNLFSEHILPAFLGLISGISFVSLSIRTKKGEKPTK